MHSTTFRLADLEASALDFPSACASEPKSLSLDEEPDDEVGGLPDTCWVGLLVRCSGSESELVSLDEVPEDDVSSLSDGSDSENADELESELSYES